MISQSFGKYQTDQVTLWRYLFIKDLIFCFKKAQTWFYPEATLPGFSINVIHDYSI